MLIKPQNCRPTALRSGIGRLSNPSSAADCADAVGDHYAELFIVQIAPGGPVEQALANAQFGQTSGLPGGGENASSRAMLNSSPGDNQYRGSRGLDPEVVAEITKRYGFDKPLHERYFTLLWNYVRFDFGDSLFRSASVVQMIKDSLPVSVSLGLWSTLIIYLVSILLGIKRRCVTAAPSISGAAR